MIVSDADQYAIRSTIEQQLLAFQNDDAEKAFSFASPLIQAKFGTAINFIHMIKIAYPAIYRPRSVLFKQLLLIQDVPAQEVMLLAADDTLMKAIYLMQKQSNSAWKIDGCVLEASQDADSTR